MLRFHWFRVYFEYMNLVTIIKKRHVWAFCTIECIAFTMQENLSFLLNLVKSIIKDHIRLLNIVPKRRQIKYSLIFILVNSWLKAKLYQHTHCSLAKTWYRLGVNYVTHDFICISCKPSEESENYKMKNSFPCTAGIEPTISRLLIRLAL